MTAEKLQKYYAAVEAGIDRAAELHDSSIAAAASVLAGAQADVVAGLFGANLAVARARARLVHCVRIKADVAARLASSRALGEGEDFSNRAAAMARHAVLVPYGLRTRRRRKRGEPRLWGRPRD